MRHRTSFWKNYQAIIAFAAITIGLLLVLSVLLLSPAGPAMLTGSSLSTWLRVVLGCFLIGFAVVGMRRGERLNNRNGRKA